MKKQKENPPEVRATHTPGPWVHIPRARDGHVDKIAIGHNVFVHVGSPECERPILDFPHENTQTANARLIAAAPDLLSACHVLALVVARMDSALVERGQGFNLSNVPGWAGRNVLDYARAVIAKAEGVTP